MPSDSNTQLSFKLAQQTANYKPNTVNNDIKINSSLAMANQAGTQACSQITVPHTYQYITKDFQNQNRKSSVVPSSTRSKFGTFSCLFTVLFDSILFDSKKRCCFCHKCSSIAADSRSYSYSDTIIGPTRE